MQYWSLNLGELLTVTRIWTDKYCYQQMNADAECTDFYINK